MSDINKIFYDTSFIVCVCSQ